MKERPMIVTGSNVPAIIKGLKTQTRRVLKGENYCNYHDYNGSFKLYDDGLWWYESVHGCADNGLKCPYGKVGDQLWVRETFAQGVLVAGDSVEGAKPPYFIEQMGSDKENDIVYRADTFNLPDYEDDPEQPVTWKPSIHMPRAFSRINLKITDIRVERVQEISENDLIAQGIQSRIHYYLGANHPVKGASKVFYQRVNAFKDIWDSINAKRGYGWEKNPWCWCITFEVIHS